MCRSILAGGRRCPRKGNYQPVSNASRKVKRAESTLESMKDLEDDDPRKTKQQQKLATAKQELAKARGAYESELMNHADLDESDRVPTASTEDAESTDEEESEPVKTAQTEAETDEEAPQGEFEVQESDASDDSVVVEDEEGEIELGTAEGGDEWAESVVAEFSTDDEEEDLFADDDDYEVDPKWTEGWGN